MRDVCEPRYDLRSWHGIFIKRERERERDREGGVPPSKRVKSDAFTGLQEIYVDTIDVVPSNFSITRERQREISYSAL